LLAENRAALNTGHESLYGLDRVFDLEPNFRRWRE
jgi:hypothetical protein